MKRFVSLLFFALLFFVNLKAQTTIYTNNMDYVIGDVKQAFVQNKITTKAQADNLIIGFKNLKVNGIRIPIFAEGLNPNKTMFDYFYTQAVANGFPIFANPAQSSGGQRIACGILNGTLSSVLNNDAKTLVLINRIKAFATEYKCTWINPFNEDGKPGAAWSVAQMNTIYASLANKLNGAELIGPCVWGIPASIAVLEQTDVAKYISVASTHNLGFNHSHWLSFISIADEAKLTVWDSEVNHSDKYGTGTRLEAALEAKVDGLVIYNSWNTISLSNGSINAGGQTLMGLYLKDNTATGRESSKRTPAKSELRFPTFISSATPKFKALNTIENRSAYALNVYSTDGKLIFATADMGEAWIPSSSQKGLYFYQVRYINNRNNSCTDKGKVIVR